MAKPYSNDGSLSKRAAQPPMNLETKMGKSQEPKVTQEQEQEQATTLMLPGDTEWEYAVIDGDWNTRKKGSTDFIVLSSLPEEKMAEAVLKLDTQFPQARTSQQKETDNAMISSMIMEMDDNSAESFMRRIGRYTK
tara:strand:+ start:1609 stop:2016 length:408 start_codon:yes stop_codon:yes gene_type:complete